MLKKAILAAVLVLFVCHPTLGETPCPTPKPVASARMKTVIDSRASPWNSDFDVAAEMTKGFVPKEKTLWTLHKTAARQDHTLTNDRDPSFQGLMTVLVHGETAAAAEPMAVALKSHARAL